MSLTLPQLSHVYPAGTQVGEHGHLEVGGCDTVSLAREFGTPAYVVVETDLRARARAFLEAARSRHRDCEVVFASKAFPCLAVLRAFGEEGLGADVASGGELALALAAGIPPQRIVVHGNAKSSQELGEAILARVGYVVLDSVNDLEHCSQAAAELGLRQPVLLRVTPDVAGETHVAISTGQADSKFGVSLMDAAAVIERAQSDSWLELAGLHVHIGSQLLDLDPFRHAVRSLARLGDFPVINLGGGLGVAYTADQQPPAVADFVEALISAVHEELGEERRLLFEPGRALVANSTVTLYTVQTVKRNVSTWVAVDGGMSDNLRPMLYGAAYEAIVADRPLAEPVTRCHLAGKHCESGDVLIRDLLLADPAVGDIVVTPGTGAYGYAMANNYNGVPRPPVVFCRDGRSRLVVRRETYADLMARDVG